MYEYCFQCRLNVRLCLIPMSIFWSLRYKNTLTLKKKIINKFLIRNIDIIYNTHTF